MTFILQNPTDARVGTKKRGIALDDNGDFVPFLSSFSKASGVVPFPDSILTEVSEVRQVMYGDGEPCNADKWNDWGYKPR